MIYLQRVQELSASDFGLEQAAYEKLLAAQQNKMEIVALTLATDEYYDIELKDGSKYAAISSYHLVLEWKH